MTESDTPKRWVSRAGEKLDHALRIFDLDVTGRRCADFGCSTGGFTDCLLQHGATEVIAVDTGYGVLDWSLRQDPRVVVRERTNVLHADPPDSGVELLVIDVGWTPQARVLPAAELWLAPEGRVVSLIKPHYERSSRPGRSQPLRGQLDDVEAHAVLEETLQGLPEIGWDVLGETCSPIRGAKSGKGKSGAGNLEFLALLMPQKKT